MNSTYDYDPASRKDELVNIAATMLDIIVPILRPDTAIIIDAFPWCGSILFTVSCSVAKYMSFKCFASHRGFLACHSRGTWLSHASSRNSTWIGRFSTLFKKR